MSDQTPRRLGFEYATPGTIVRGTHAELEHYRQRPTAHCSLDHDAAVRQASRQVHDSAPHRARKYTGADAHIT